MKALLVIILLIALVCLGVIPEQWFIPTLLLWLTGTIASLAKGNRRGYQPRVKVDYDHKMFAPGKRHDD